MLLAAKGVSNLNITKFCFRVSVGKTTIIILTITSAKPKVGPKVFSHPAKSLNSAVSITSMATGV